MTQTQKKDKQPMKDKKKVVDPEAEEGHGTEEIDAKGLEPIIRLLEYIPSWKGKVKVPRGPDSKKFTISTPLLPEKVPFEGRRLMRITLLEMENWDLTDEAKFPHLVTVKYLRKVYYIETGVTMLEREEWVCGVEQSGLLNLLWVPHYHNTPINTICVCQLLTLVRDGCLGLGGPIPITNMIIHRITHLPYEGLNSAKEFY